uniref:Uncharacterized protein n=1 Tax=Ditylenchus dipsaci TaxID=166011 RepID=A0A915DMQ5_9BILA
MRWLNAQGLKPDRKGVWTFAAQEDSQIRECPLNCGLDLHRVPSVAECLYAAFSSEIHRTYPDLMQGSDGKAIMRAGSLRNDEKIVFRCLAKSFNIVVVYE